MGIFDSIVQQAKHSLGLSEAKASGLVAALLQLITNRSTGGFGGFIGRFRDAGLGALVDSWITRGANNPISNAQVVSALERLRPTDAKGRQPERRLELSWRAPNV
jgi:uncharacterized protein YidB (DUF937 family)